MPKDPILAEVERAKKQLADAYGRNTRRLLEELQAKYEKLGYRMAAPRKRKKTAPPR